MPPRNAATVSVIIPTFNRRAFIGRALASVRRQTRRPFEIIVVDDGSTDGTGEWLGQAWSSVTYVWQDNAGPAVARNRGLKAAGGELIAFLDSDDFWPEDRLDVLASVLEHEADIAIVSGRVQSVRASTDDGDAFVRLWHPVHNFASLCPSLIRAECFDRVGPFDAGFRHGEDWDWMLRAFECGIGRRFVDDVTSFYLRHESNMTGDERSTEQGVLLAIRRSLERRRRDGGAITPELPSWVYPFPRFR